ncbi:MAG: thioredoxin family protein [Puniceicoccales bacterium]|nr:thioredoxin family protein [Puniceicoccales bacterium]
MNKKTRAAMHRRFQKIFKNLPFLFLPAAVALAFVLANTALRRETASETQPPAAKAPTKSAVAKKNAPSPASAKNTGATSFESAFPDFGESVSPLVVDWHTDFDEARRVAQKTGKDILVAFVSVDSSIWSRRLDTDVFGSPAFAVTIAPHFVCVLLEFPRTYSLPSAEQTRNEHLRAAWRISTFPTIFLADKTARPYAVTGYRDNTAADYARHLLALRNIRLHRDQSLGDAAKAATNAERAVLLSQALEGIDENILLRHYKGELDALKRADPQDSTGLLGNIRFTPKLNQLSDQVTRLIRQRKDFSGALETVDKFITQNAPVGEHLQRALFLKLLVYGNREAGNHASIVKLMDEIIAVNSENEQGRMAAEARKHALSVLAAEREAAEKAAAEKEVAEREAAEKAAAEKEAAEREAAEREAAEKETAGGEVAGKETAGKETAGKETAGKVVAGNTEGCEAHGEPVPTPPQEKPTPEPDAPEPAPENAPPEPTPPEPDTPENTPAD